MFAPTEIIQIPLRSARSLVSRCRAPRCVPAACLLILVSIQSPVAHAQDLGPFEALDSIPSSVDAAAVFQNPAETLLLSPAGRSIRTLMTMGSVFTQTERAWKALGDAFNAPVDDTIRALLSKRVVVVWDGLERAAPDLMGFTKSIDTRWALICEVDPKYLDEIRSAMRPVKRDIVHGRAVYAIEQGRYRVVMIQNTHPNTKALVLLAPSSGTELLHSVLAQLVLPGKPKAETASLISAHRDMLASFVEEHANASSEQPTFAFMARTGIVLDTLPNQITPRTPNQAEQDPILAAMVGFNQDGMRCMFASDVPVRKDIPDAPIALYEATSQNAVIAIASAQSGRLNLTANSASITMGLASDAAPDAEVQQSPTQDEDIFDAPMLITVAPMNAAPGQPAGAERMGMCLTLLNPKRAQGQSAFLADQAVRGYIESYDPAQAPSFQGRFPAVPRSIALQTQATQDAVHDDPGGPSSQSDTPWLTQSPQIAWLTTPSISHDYITASISPQHTLPVPSVIEVHQAVLTLDALGADHASGVLLRARMQPARAIELLSDSSMIDLAFAKLVNEIRLDIRRGIKSGLRGTLEIDFANPYAKPTLGGN